MRVLVLNHRIPFPPIGGGDLRTHHLIRALRARHEVLVAGFCFPEDDHACRPFPVPTIEAPWQWPPLYVRMMEGDEQESMAAYEELLSTDEPWFVSSMRSPALEERLRQLRAEDFDVVLIEHTNMARFLPALPPDVPTILDLHNVHALIAGREIDGKSGEERDRAAREAERTLRFERQAVSRCACCLVVSSAEESAARALLGARRVHVVANGVDTTAFRPTEEKTQRPYLLFTGMMNYGPNIEAVVYFVQQVLPAIRQQVPGVELHIVGADPQPEVRRLACSDVVIHGYVPDVHPFYREAAVVVVPLLHGGGTRLKILEAAASGKAIVSTSLGAEGLSLEAGEDILLADTPPDFARAVVLLLSDDAARQRLGRQACRAVQGYDWQGIGERFVGIVEEVVESRTACSSGAFGTD